MEIQTESIEWFAVYYIISRSKYFQTGNACLKSASAHGDTPSL
ncbi:hypothetical protein HMPREF9370_1969 [Neisseria wadsworthii 9715]|uniref:Uncharacterized protein n=1 Tax=Neisseria wadsworthii 9715 TaxID=1030841 RepID=G4CSA9_9NEIS|nr:hypothetical protein HMPREF9370_1969 [Neisseria wadsworthii 9715]